MSCVLFNSVTWIIGIKFSHIEFKQRRPCYSKPSKAIPGDIKVPRVQNRGLTGVHS